ncbi:unnamed protein product [Camellia sinensis]
MNQNPPILQPEHPKLTLISSNSEKHRVFHDTKLEELQTSGVEESGPSRISRESKTSGAAKTLIVDDREGFRAFSGEAVEGKERRESSGLTTMAEKLDDEGDGNGGRIVAESDETAIDSLSEKVFVPNSKPYISFIGDENQTSETIITWNDKASDKDNNGCQLGTSRSASVTIESDFFCATGITFENSVVAVPRAYGIQAVALRLAVDKAMLYKVRVLGTQDTLLDDYGSHYFFQCYIQGSVDFIFGRSRPLYQDCVLHSTAERFGAIAAHHRDSQYDDTGFSFVNCTINGSGIVYLGRAWGNYSRRMESTI